MKINRNTTWKAAAIVGASAVLLSPSAFALTGFDLDPAHAGGGGYNYAVIFQGGAGNQLNINNGAVAPDDTGIKGNIGVAGTGELTLSNVRIDGNINFAAPVVLGGNYKPNGQPVTGTVNGSVASVQTTMNYLNGLSQTLFGEAGTAITLAGSTTINASAGILDASGNKVFTATMTSDLGGDIITINGDGSHKVVINIATVKNFHPNQILLTGGLTPDDVLWNFYGGVPATLKDGPTLDINSNGGLLRGVFLDPYGKISVVHSLVDGRVFGGDSVNEQLVSGEYISSPAVSSPPTGPSENVPDGGSTLALLAMGLGTLLVGARKLAA